MPCSASIPGASTSFLSGFQDSAYFGACDGSLGFATELGSR
jgi:hypothetical protein